MASAPDRTGVASATSNVVSIRTPYKDLRVRLNCLSAPRALKWWMDDVAKADKRGAIDKNEALYLNALGWAVGRKFDEGEAA